MADEPDNLTLVFLLRMDAKLDQITDTLADHGRRLTSLEVAMGNLAATEASHYANTMLRIDGLAERLTRVERRMDIREA